MLSSDDKYEIQMNHVVNIKWRAEETCLFNNNYYHLQNNILNVSPLCKL